MTLVNKLLVGDCLGIMTQLHKMPTAEKIKLVVIDPPVELWKREIREVQVEFLRTRLHAAAQLLDTDAAIVIYADCRHGHHLRFLADQVFGEGAFRSEIFLVDLDPQLKAWSREVGALTVESRTLLVYAARPESRLKYPGKWETCTIVKKGIAFKGKSAVDMPAASAQTMEFPRERILRAIENYREFRMNYAQEMSIDVFHERHRGATGESLEFLRLEHGAVQFYISPDEHEACTNVWTDLPVEEQRVTLHPQERSLPPLQRLIEWFTEPGDLVLDPFAGSGSTLIAAQAMNRPWVGIEKEEEWVRVAQERLHSLSTGG